MTGTLRSPALAVVVAAGIAAPARADGAHPDPGHLRQTVLLILRFPPEGMPGALTAADEAHVEQSLQTASDFLWNGSNGSLRVQFQVVKVFKSLTAADYHTYGSSGSAAKLTQALYNELAARGLDPKRFAGVMMIYRPTGATGTIFNNTWIYFNEEFSSSPKQPGFSSVIYNSGNVLGEVVVHEYLHQLDHRFQYEANDPDPNTRGFLNPDDMNAPSGQRLAYLLGTPFAAVDYYRAMLKYYIGSDTALRPVNYHWLQGARGVFDGDEVKKLYNFGVQDDNLVPAGGDNLYSLNNSTSPSSFQFHADPGHTAAFRTRTANGRFLLRSVSFNYELAAGDYTFQVWLVGYGNKGNLVQRRIDDGIYTLGRGHFSSQRKTITLNNEEIEDFAIVFRKGNQLPARLNDWALLGNIALDVAPAP